MNPFWIANSCCCFMTLLLLAAEFCHFVYFWAYIEERTGLGIGQVLTDPVFYASIISMQVVYWTVGLFTLFLLTIFMGYFYVWSREEMSWRVSRRGDRYRRQHESDILV